MQHKIADRKKRCRRGKKHQLRWIANRIQIQLVFIPSQCKINMKPMREIKLLIAKNIVDAEKTPGRKITYHIQFQLFFYAIAV